MHRARPDGGALGARGRVLAARMGCVIVRMGCVIVRMGRVVVPGGALRRGRGVAPASGEEHEKGKGCLDGEPGM